MVRRSLFSSAVFFSLSLMISGCTVEVTDPNAIFNPPVSPTDPAPVVPGGDPQGQPGSELVDVPAVTDVGLFALIDTTSGMVVEEIQPLENGSVIDLSVIPFDRVNIIAEAADVNSTGSVHFRLDGPVSIDRSKNNHVNTMAIQQNGLDLTSHELPVGDYSLSITTYQLPDMQGEVGQTKTLSFEVIDSATIGPNVPGIASVRLISVTETGNYVMVEPINNGATLDLSKVSTNLVNIVALSEDISRTGSVRFVLTGPVSIDRIENTHYYALANEANHLDISKGQLPAGSYSLVITPFAERNAKGASGIARTLHFSVLAKQPAPVAPQPVVPVVPAPVAVADSYTFQVGSSAQPGQTVSVAANDTYIQGEATFRIVTAPKNGSASMFDLGFFTYTPDFGFVGSDSFTYEVRQAGKTSTARVALTVVDSTGAQKGFTVVKPSADSRLVYVSSSTGSDTNTCLSEAAPCKTITAGLNKMRNGFPDHLYLKRGDTWRDERLVNLHSGRSASEPAVITYYGNSGDRPRIANANHTLHVYKGVMKNFSFIGIEFYAYKLDPNHPEFNGADKANVFLLGGNENIVFEDNKFSHTEIVLQLWETGKPTNITVRRNIFTGAYYNESANNNRARPSNLYAAGAEGLLIEENVFDYGGWHPRVAGAAANMFNHNIYIQTTTNGNKLVIRRNIITRGSSLGVHGRPGGLFEDNFFARNAISLQMGYKGTPLQAGTRAHAINNVITEGHSMVKGNGACSGQGLCTAALWGLHIEEFGQGDFLLKGNIVHSRDPSDTEWNRVFNSLVVVDIRQHTASNIKYENNIAWKWRTTSEPANAAYPAPGRTLADYNQSLGGQKDFDAFMNVVKNRPVGVWDTRYTAPAINNYIRAGFGR